MSATLLLRQVTEATPDAPQAAPPPCQRPIVDWASAPLHVVWNGRSGRHEGATPFDQRLAELLQRAGRPFRLHQAARPRELPALADRVVQLARADGGIVVAAGGDGTINTVVQALWRWQVPFGVLPQGTFNYFGRAHGVAQETDEAVATLLAGLAQRQLKPVQVGLVNDRVFLVNASLGLYPELLEDRERMKRRYGRSRIVAWVSGALTLLRPHRGLQIQLRQIDPDGSASPPEPRRIATLFVGNNPLQFEQIGLDEAEAVRRGRLGAVVLAPAGRWALVKLALRGWWGRLRDADEIENFAFSRLEVGRLGRRAGQGGRVKVAFDGESARLQTPLEFRVAPLPLWLVVPPDLEPLP